MFLLKQEILLSNYIIINKLVYFVRQKYTLQYTNRKVILRIHTCVCVIAKHKNIENEKWTISFK